MRTPRRIFLACSVIFLAFTLPAAAQPSPGMTASPDSGGANVLVPDTNSIHYARGVRTARKKAFFPGVFATGFLFGMTAPAPASIGGIKRDAGDGLKITAGAVGVSLWIWGGKCLATHPSIQTPKRHRKGLSGQEQVDFDAGYAAVARGKRSFAYTAGVAGGVITDAILAGLLFAAIANSDWGYGPAY